MCILSKLRLNHFNQNAEQDDDQGIVDCCYEPMILRPLILRVDITLSLFPFRIANYLTSSLIFGRWRGLQSNLTSFVSDLNPRDRSVHTGELGLYSSSSIFINRSLHLLRSRGNAGKVSLLRC